MKLTDCQILLKKGLIGLSFEYPLYGHLVIYLKLIESKSVDTIAINANSEVYYNPDFIKKYSDEVEIKFLLLHELLHLLLGHCFEIHKFKDQDLKLYMIAADIVVNYMLEKLNRYYWDFKHKPDLKEIGLWPDVSNDSIQIGLYTVKDISKKSTMNIYEELRENLKEKIEKKPIDVILKHSFDQKTGGKKKIPPELIKDLKEKLKARIVNASMIAKLQGCDTKGLDRIFKIWFPATIRWSSLIRHLMSKMKYKGSWRKPSKKYYPKFYLPSRVKTKSLKAVIAFDTSGSISDKEFNRIVSEVLGLVSEFRSFEFWIADCDTEIYNFFKVTPENKEKLRKVKYKGRGGTSFVPVFEKIKKELNDKIDLLIYFTDGYGEFPKKKPNYPVYWVRTTESAFVDWPFGKVIKLNN